MDVAGASFCHSAQKCQKCVDLNFRKVFLLHSVCVCFFFLSSFHRHICLRIMRLSQRLLMQKQNIYISGRFPLIRWVSVWIANESVWFVFFFIFFAGVYWLHSNDLFRIIHTKNQLPEMKRKKKKNTRPGRHSYLATDAPKKCNTILKIC